MNILVTGANGQLGREMRLVARGSADSYVFTDVVEAEGVETTRLDITSAADINEMVAERDIACVINCAAWTNVDACETDPKLAALAHRLNAEAPGLLASAMARRGGLMVHISTDYVFGREPYNVPCREDQQGTPTGVYGATKLAGERAIQASGCQYVILRTAWLYSEYGRNFVKTMLRLTSEKPELRVVIDQAGTPTYALDLARAIHHIVGQRLYEGRTGIYHYSNEGVTSWYDFTRMIASLAGHTACRILPCRSSEFASPVQRPAYSVLDKTKIKTTFGLDIPYWVDSLRTCLSHLA